MVEKLSLWSLILNASLLVQLVMLLLMVMSITSWVFILQRRQYFNRARRGLREFEEKFWSGVDLSQLFREVNNSPNAHSGLENIFRAGLKEFTRMRQQTESDRDATMEGVQRAMRVALAREEEKLESHLPFLATVGSISPYIGLFGTVWGIMNSFRGLANVHQATLASVAPGISEALIATAIGLFAAIPAVVAYNRYSARMETLMNNYETFAEEFYSILHRRVHGNM